MKKLDAPTLLEEPTTDGTEWVEWTVRRVVFNSRREIDSRVPTIMHLGPATGAAVEAQLRSRAALDDEPLSHKGRIYANGHLYMGGASMPIWWGDPRGNNPPIFEVRYRIIDDAELPVRQRRNGTRSGTAAAVEALRLEVAELGKLIDEQNVEIDNLRSDVVALREAFGDSEEPGIAAELNGEDHHEPA